tara:strand:+ start:8298 stop:9173 length:876 start_codon:yes stop_codon:yes gene_type:complete
MAIEDVASSGTGGNWFSKLGSGLKQSFGKAGQSLKGLGKKIGPGLEKAGAWMEKNPKLTQIGLSAAGSLFGRRGGGGGGAMGGGMMGGGGMGPGVEAANDPNYFNYLNDIKRRRMAYQSGSAYAPEREALMRTFATGAKTVRQMGGGSGAHITALRRMMSGVSAGLADIKSKTAAPMEAKLFEMEGSAVDTISGRALELGLLGQAKGEAQEAAAQTRGAIRGQDMLNLVTPQNIKGLSKFISGIGKKWRERKDGDPDKEEIVTDEKGDVLGDDVGDYVIPDDDLAEGEAIG